MQSVTILAEQNAKLRASNHHQRQKNQYRQYIATGGVLQAQQGQDLVRQAENDGLVVTSQSQLRHVQEHHERVANATYTVMTGDSVELSNLP